MDSNDRFLTVLIADLMISLAAGAGAFLAIWAETWSLPKSLGHGVAAVVVAVVFFAAVDAAKIFTRK